MRKALALATVIWLVGPLAEARVFTAPFDTGSVAVEFREGRVGYYAGYNRLEGRLQLYGIGLGHASVPPWEGQGRVVATLGSYYPINSGPTLNEPFSAPFTLMGVAEGRLYCSSPSSDDAYRGSAWIEAKAQRDVQVGAGWERLEDIQFYFRSQQCHRLQTIDTPVADGLAFTSDSVSFEPGRVYRLVLEGRVGWYGGYLGGVGIADFCSDSTYCQGVNGPTGNDQVRLNSISIPNQAPRGSFYSTSRWYVDNLLAMTSIGGVVCDYDGLIVSTTVSVDGLTLLADSSASTSASRACVELRFNTRFAAPGTYSGVISGRDDEGAEGRNGGRVSVTVLPMGPVAGMLGLEAIPEEALGPSVDLVAVAGPEGTIRGARIASGGIVLADTLPLLPGLHDRHIRVLYDRAGAQASILLDGATVWTGAVQRSGAGWWEIEPLASAGVDLPGLALPVPDLPQVDVRLPISAPPAASAQEALST